MATAKNVHAFEFVLIAHGCSPVRRKETTDFTEDYTDYFNSCNPLSNLIIFLRKNKGKINFWPDERGEIMRGGKKIEAA
jgi:hypothetical protein